MEILFFCPCIKTRQEKCNFCQKVVKKSVSLTDLWDAPANPVRV